MRKQPDTDANEAIDMSKYWTLSSVMVLIGIDLPLRASAMLLDPQTSNSSTDEVISIQTPVRTSSAAARCLCVCQDALIGPGDCLSLGLGKACGSLVRGIRRVEAVDDGVDHDRLLGDGEGAVRWDCDPVVWKKVSASMAAHTRPTYLARM